MDKPADNDHPIHDLLRRRWSPRAFDPRAIPPAQVRSLLEAARWAPSSYNQQPWRFLIAVREDEDEFARLNLPPAEERAAWQAVDIIKEMARARRPPFDEIPR